MSATMWPHSGGNDKQTTLKESEIEMTLSRRILVGCLTVLGSCLITQTARADFIIFSGTSPDRSATARFDLTGNTLTVTLTNTWAGDVDEPAFVLTALFFDYTGPGTLSKVSATIAPGSSVVNTEPLLNPVVAGNVGGEWAFRDDLPNGAVTPGNQQFGISSVGLNLFAPTDRFDTGPNSNLLGPEEPDGAQFGLVSAGYTTANDNGGLSSDNNGAFIKNAVVFQFTVSGGTFDLNSLTDVRFQYGTGLSEPFIPGIPRDPLNPTPAPPALVLALTGLACFGGLGLRRRLRGSAAAV